MPLFSISDLTYALRSPQLRIPNDPFITSLHFHESRYGNVTNKNRHIFSCIFISPIKELNVQKREKINKESKCRNLSMKSMLSRIYLIVSRSIDITFTFTFTMTIYFHSHSQRLSKARFCMNHGENTIISHFAQSPGTGTTSSKGGQIRTSAVLNKEC